MPIDPNYKATKTVSDYTLQQVENYILEKRPETILQARYDLGLSPTSTIAGNLIKQAAKNVNHAWRSARYITARASSKIVTVNPPETQAEEQEEIVNEFLDGSIVGLFTGEKKIVTLNIRDFIRSIGVDNASKEASAIRRMIFSHVVANSWINYEFLGTDELANCRRSDQECYDALYAVLDRDDAIDVIKLANNEHSRGRFDALIEADKELKDMIYPPAAPVEVDEDTKQAVLALWEKDMWTPKGIASMLKIDAVIVEEIVTSP